MVLGLGKGASFDTLLSRLGLADVHIYIYIYICIYIYVCVHIYIIVMVESVSIQTMHFLAFQRVWACDTFVVTD